jgi:hypothetical protein
MFMQEVAVVEIESESLSYTAEFQASLWKQKGE